MLIKTNCAATHSCAAADVPLRNDDNGGWENKGQFLLSNHPNPNNRTLQGEMTS